MASDEITAGCVSGVGRRVGLRGRRVRPTARDFAIAGAFAVELDANRA
jgi:hypothetical protein